MAALPFRRTDTGNAPRTAFVLSGGGNQGVAQVGMLQALVERGIIPDVIVGTSAGAINGAAFAANPTPAGVDHLAEVWRALRTEDVFPGSRLSRAWNILRRSTHLFSNDGLRGVVDALPVNRFEELSIPMRVVATDLDTGEELVFAAGPVRPAILASASLPGVFPPVVHGGRHLIDGGVVNNVPLHHALMGPVDRIYLLNVSGATADGPIRFPLDVVLRAFTIARNRRYELEMAAVPPSVEVIEIPRPEDGRSIFDFTGSDTIIDEAYSLASHFLDEQKLGNAPLPAASPRRRWFRRPAAVVA